MLRRSNTRRLSLRLFVVLALFGLVASVSVLRAQDDSGNGRRGRKYKAPPPSSRIEVTVVKADNGKPIMNASVIFHPIEGDKDKGTMELKTNEDGKAIIDVIPIGDTVRLQIIAPGFQTYGHDYKVDKDAMTMEVHLKRPVAEYSIYGHHDSASSGSSDKGQPPPASDEKKDDPPASGDKPSDSGSPSKNPPSDQSGSQPDQSQSKPNAN
jgi:hypothetical protein